MQGFRAISELKLLLVVRRLAGTGTGCEAVESTISKTAVDILFSL